MPKRACSFFIEDDEAWALDWKTMVRRAERKAFAPRLTACLAQQGRSTEHRCNSRGRNDCIEKLKMQQLLLDIPIV